MKLNIANPETGASKLIEIDDEKKLRIFFDKQMSHEVEADALGDEFKGYVFKIAGGNDKQGFPMMQGVHVNGRVRLLLKKGQKCFRERRDGERKRKSVRGCIVGPDMSVLSLVVVKKGEGELPGLTDKYIPRPFGPKRASKIRKLFNLTKEDDVTKYALKKVAKFTTKAGVAKELVKIPKIQRLVTKRKIDAWKRKRLLKQKRQTKNKLEAEAYAKLISDRQEAQRAKRQSVVEAARRASQKGEAKAEAKPAKDNKKRAAPAKGAKKAVKKATTEKTAPKTVKAAKPAKPVSKKAAAKPAKPVAKKPAAKPVAEKPAKPAAKPGKAAAKAPAKAAAKKAAAKK